MTTIEQGSNAGAELFLLDEGLRKDCLTCARGLADWIFNNQAKPQGNEINRSPAATALNWIVTPDGNAHLGPNWTNAFAIMGTLGAAEAFGEERYRQTALHMANWLRTLQIFDPFHKEHYGAFREYTPSTDWSYPRDAISVAWSFLDLYEHTGNDEFLERARLFAEWFVTRGTDEDAWAWFGVAFDPPHERDFIQNHLQANCEGGSLNFLYHLARLTGDEKWTGDVYRRMAEMLATHVQQDTGYYATIERATKKPPKREDDPLADLHHANDDLCSLGMLGAYRVTGEEKYLRSAERFLTAVWSDQREDGMFDETVDASAVVLNASIEASKLGVVAPKMDKASIERALRAIFAAQSDGAQNHRMYGGLVERKGKVFSRSTCYALIVLLKLAAGVDKYLAV